MRSTPTVLALVLAAAAANAQTIGPWPESLDLLTLDGLNGFTMPGLANGDWAGAAVAIIGDVNGDGVDDMAIGIHGLNDRAGGVVVVYGRARGAGFPAIVELAGLQPGEGFRVLGETRVEEFGRRLSGAGDVNGDGLDDFLVSAPGARLSSGDAYLIFGSAGPQPISRTTSQLGAGEAVRLRGRTVGSIGDLVGWGLAGLGDFNGDGVDDLAIGAPGVGGAEGRAYVIFGHTGAWPAEIELRDLAAADGLVISAGAGAGAGLGWALAAGDVDADGLGDLLISAPPASPGARSGAGSVYLLYGSPSLRGTLQLPVLDATVSTRFDGLHEDGRVGVALAVLDDTNADGHADVAIARPRSSGASPSRVMVRFGSGGPAPFLAIEPLWGTHPSLGFDVIAGRGLDDVGEALAAADLDADGLSDLVVGIPETSYLGEPGDAGRVYIFFGGVPRDAALDPLAVREGVTFLSGATEEASAGRALSAAGDVNGDGIADLLIGAPTRRGRVPGAAHVVFGRRGHPCPPDIDGDGLLTVFDFLAFQNLFQAGDLAADFDGDGALTLFDFLGFQTAFDAGCP